MKPYNNSLIPFFLIILLLWRAPEKVFAFPAVNEKADGFRNVLTFQMRPEELAKQARSAGKCPFAEYSAHANKTFFCFNALDETTGETLLEIAAFDHAARQVSKPTILERLENNVSPAVSTLTIGQLGYIWIFSPAPQGQTMRVYCSRRPYNTDAFDRISMAGHGGFPQTAANHYVGIQAFSLPKGFVVLYYVRSDTQRTLCCLSSQDGHNWSAQEQPVAVITPDSCQTTAVWKSGNEGKVGTVFICPGNNLSDTNSDRIYYLETRNQGQTWLDVLGNDVSIPLKSVDSQGFVGAGTVKILDLAFQSDGKPVILYVKKQTVPQPEGSASSNPPFLYSWKIAIWNGVSWTMNSITQSDSLQEFGSLYIDSDGVWRMIGGDGISESGDVVGGLINLWTSSDCGVTWKRCKRLSTRTGVNSYTTRKPVNAEDDFYALWTDSQDVPQKSSNLYMSNSSGEVFQLPRRMDEDWVNVEDIQQ